MLCHKISVDMIGVVCRFIYPRRKNSENIRKTFEKKYNCKNEGLV